ncbi:GNAT family N-acetyltransferase [Kineococcus sp. SYSU DK001]|uniref:GNAT family N-acetyltransferase n=1 Tax=Kineococcus sp. SYSU DK001 TaxID=3383122 RepID=UPI003D7E2A41
MATAPDDTCAQVLQRGLDDLWATSPTAFPGPATPPGSSGLTPESSSRLAAGLPVREALGPTDVAYLPTGSPTAPTAPPTTPPAAGDAVRTVDATDPLVPELLAACSAVDAAEAALDSLASPAFVLLREGTALAVAGYELWPSGIAHLCVLTHPAARGTGLARIVASAATDHALRAGLLPQWRARPLASRRVAYALGYRSLGHQVSLRLAV